MEGKFTLTISLGNDKMRRRSDVAAALVEVAKQVCARRNVTQGSIRDTNGNTVGSWAFETEK